MMGNNSGDQQYVKDSRKPEGTPEKCPACGSPKVISCPGGMSVKAVPGIWWVCDDCKHQW
jgi:hypothetical protein